MKVIVLNGSPKAKGSTFTALSIIKKQLGIHGIEVEIFNVGTKPLRGCIACMKCRNNGQITRCVFDDDIVNKLATAISNADGFIVGSPVHYASASGAVTSVLDRLFFSTPAETMRMKFAASIVACRRGGATAAFDQLNKYFTISQMPIVSSCYWNGIHGNNPEEVVQDIEGIRIMKTLADNMAYLIKCKHIANLELPEVQPSASTNFIR